MSIPEPSADEREVEALLIGDLPSESERRYAWVFTGSGHYLRESLEFALALDNVDFFLSRAAEEVLPMYGWPLVALKERLAGRGRVFRETNYSSVPVGLLYRGFYHTVVLGPATSNSVAKCVVGISDTLATNMYAQAGKCRIESIVFACDSEPVVVTDAPNRRVVLYPRRIDLDNTARLRSFEYTTVVSTPEELAAALARRNAWLKELSRAFSS
jgi:dihydromethanopterin reductase (acceptor)